MLAWMFITKRADNSPVKAKGPQNATVAAVKPPISPTIRRSNWISHQKSRDRMAPVTKETQAAVATSPQWSTWPTSLTRNRSALPLGRWLSRILIFVTASSNTNLALEKSQAYPDPQPNALSNKRTSILPRLLWKERECRLNGKMRGRAELRWI